MLGRLCSHPPPVAPDPRQPRPGAGTHGSGAPGPFLRAAEAIAAGRAVSRFAFWLSKSGIRHQLPVHSLRHTLPPRRGPSPRPRAESALTAPIPSEWYASQLGASSSFAPPARARAEASTAVEIRPRRWRRPPRGGKRPCPHRVECGHGGHHERAPRRDSRAQIETQRVRP